MVQTTPLAPSVLFTGEILPPPLPDNRILRQDELRNLELVLELYEAVNQENALGVRAALAEDVDWWFHGPRSTPARNVNRFQVPTLNSSQSELGTGSLFGLEAS